MQAETPSDSSHTGAASGELEQAPGSPLRLGPFHVSTDAADVAAFRAETGWSGSLAEVRNFVPHTFPMRWLSSPEIKTILQAKMENAKGIAIHEAQSFQYEKPLKIDQHYLMTLDVEETTAPSRLILRVLVAMPPDRPCLRMETILRMVSGETAQ